MNKKVNVTVERNSFVVTVNKCMIHFVKDFAQRFNSFAYVYDKRKKRKMPVLDKKFYAVEYLEDKAVYRFTRESLMDFAVYSKLRGLDIQDKRDFEVVPKVFRELPDIDLKLREKFKLRDYQDKYLNAVIDNKMPKALIELQTGRGKFQSLDSLIRIPNGWKRMGDIKVDDYVIARDGTATKVIGVHPQDGLQKIFKITFADGRSTECGAPHLWKVYQEGKKPKIIETSEIKRRLIEGFRCYIDLPEPEKCDDKTFILTPEYAGYFISNSLIGIPDYLFNGSYRQKMSLLLSMFGNRKESFVFGETYYFKTPKEYIARDIQKLVRSLGGIAKYSYFKQNDAYVLEMRCLNKTKDTKTNDKENLYFHKLEIRSIEYIGDKEAQCISIEHPEHLYITDDYIVTHNTLIACAIAAKKKKKVCLLLPGYIEKWQQDVIDTLEVTSRDICVLQGNLSIKKLLDIIHKDGKTDYKIFIVSAKTLMIYSKARDEYGSRLYIPIDKLFEDIEIGTILIDEIHEKFFATFYLNLFLNPELLIGTTATYTSGNAYMRKFQDVMFPRNTRLNFVEINKYIHTYAISYRFDNKRQIHCKLSGMYNHDTYESATIIGNRSRLLNFLDMLKYYFNLEFISKYKEKDKITIFVASVRFATMLVNYFTTAYPKLDVRRYTSDDSYDNLMQADVIISTLQSAGTAVDIPGLRVVFNTVVTTSEIRNKQSHGRLRELEDVPVLYYYFYCEDVDKHIEFHKSRVDHLRPYSKEFNFIKYDRPL